VPERVPERVQEHAQGRVQEHAQGRGRGRVQERVPEQHRQEQREQGLGGLQQQPANAHPPHVVLLDDAKYLGGGLHHAQSVRLSSRLS
jgi:hypothetical protein